MNPLELYKQLPRKNCKACRPRACMPFAIACIAGEIDLAECPLLTPEEVCRLKESIGSADWREELVVKLKDEIGHVRFADVSAGLGAELSGEDLVLKCLGREFTVTPQGEIMTKGRMTPWIKILILHYIRTAGTGGLTGKWVSYGDLKGGMVKATSFLRECEEPLRELLEREEGRVGTVLSRLGSETSEGFPAPRAWTLLLLPKLPIAVLWWPEEEEFPARVKVLFDSSADRFLDAESIIFLVEGLVKNLEMSH